MSFLQFGIPVHEVGHTLGLWHEQMRVDRDDYIRINWENVGFYRGQLVKVDYAVGLGVRYDYQSVMHYSPLVNINKTVNRTSKHKI